MKGESQGNECMNELETLPPYDADRFYRRIAELTEKYFENSENKKKFEEWKKTALAEEIRMEENTNEEKNGENTVRLADGRGGNNGNI